MIFKIHVTGEKRKLDLEKDGEHVFNSLPISDHPVMIPSAPNLSPYIDKYDEEEDLSKSSRSSRQRQQDYETEVVVYRALEKLKSGEKIIVLHGLQYSHGDYQLFVGEHNSKKRKGEICKLKNKEREEECDFVVMCDSCFVVIEVKNVFDIDDEKDEEQKYRALSKTFEDSLDQRMRTVKIIQGINKDATVHQFTAYPNFKRFQGDLKLNHNQSSTIIFKEDIDDFSAWWRDHMQNPTEFQSKIQKEKHILLALWSTEKNKCDKLKCCLGSTIMEIDKSLRNGNFTFRSKNRDQNPGVALETPQVIKNYVGVNNLTVQQLAALKSDQSLMWINGPAGAGKSVVLCGKIIEMAQYDKKSRIVLFMFGGCGFNSLLYRNSFDKADIKYELITPDSHKDSEAEICKIIKVKMLTNQVVVLEQKDLLTMLTKSEIIRFLKEEKDHHIFIDDVQCLFRWVLEEDKGGTARIETFVNAVIEFSLSSIIWVACDLVQCAFDTSDGAYVTYLQHELNGSLASKQRLTLSKNLRNTFDLSEILSTIRNQYIEIYMPEISDEVLPKQEIGHFIHGPRTAIHISDDLDEITQRDTICAIVSKELDKLTYNESMRLKDNSDYHVGVIMELTIRSTKKKLATSLSQIIVRYNNLGNRISFFNGNLSNSAEFSAVIVLQRLWGRPTFNHNGAEDIRSLYSFISRARVYCSVVLFRDLLNGGGKTLQDLKHITDLLEKLSGQVQILKY